METKQEMGTTEVSKDQVRANLYSDTTVAVRYIIDLKNNVTDKDHTLYGGLTKEAVIGVPAPLNVAGQLLELHEIFTKEELTVLAHDLGDPRVTDFTSSFWKDGVYDEFKQPLSFFPILLKKEGMTLDLNRPEDVIKYRILYNSSIVAKDMESRFDRASFRFYMVNSKDVLKSKMAEVDAKKRAFITFGKISNQPKILMYILKTLGVDVASDSSDDYLVSELFDQVERKPKEFNAVAEDPNLVCKIMIGDFVKAGLMVVKNELYYSKDGNPIAMDGHTNNLSGAATYFNSPLGNTAYLQMKEGLKQLAQASKEQ